jgi:hypothetical protein
MKAIFISSLVVYWEYSIVPDPVKIILLGNSIIFCYEDYPQRGAYLRVKAQTRARTTANTTPDSTKRTPKMKQLARVRAQKTLLLRVVGLPSPSSQQVPSS